MKSYLAPLLLLAAIVTFSLVNCRFIVRSSLVWDEELESAAALASDGDWSGAENALRAGYRAWSAHQTWLHIVVDHDAVDGAEAMYRRAFAFADAQEPSEFQAEIADLRSQIRLLAEMERVSVKNIL